MSDPRYPVGPFVSRTELTPDERRVMIEEIAETPARFRAAVSGLDEAQLNTPYREGGWTVREVAHHVPDSHMNAFLRFKFALTEDNPTIKPYDEATWAKLADVRETPVEVSLALLDALHARWTVLLRTLKDEDFRRTLVHPEHGPRTVDWLLAMYSWHGRHHTGHVTSLRERMRW
jgi:uncharacterized damage-inducible protein DinB